MSQILLNSNTEEENLFKIFFRRFQHHSFTSSELKKYFPFHSSDEITHFLNKLLDAKLIEQSGDLFTFNKNKE